MTASRSAIGLMTGTVVDGNVDIALIAGDGTRIDRFGPYRLSPYPPGVVPLIEAAVTAAQSWGFEGPDPAIFAEAEAALTRAQAAAVVGFLEEEGIDPASVAAIGFHGQTVLHRAPEGGRIGATRQLGDGALMARLTGIDTVFDFRSADVAAGGQGAPLVPLYHVALLARLGTGRPAAVLNLGGVGNVTWWDGRSGLEAGAVAAFDTGPANAPIDDWVRRHGLGRFDRDGALAARGRVDEGRVAARLADPWFDRPYPKSLDRNGFGLHLAEGLSIEDGAATLTALSAAAVGRALDLLPQRPERLIVCGGGRKNPTLMRFISERARVAVVDADALGWRGDAVEAECFAHLALRRIDGLATSFPATTGAPAPIVGGRIAYAER